MDMSNQRTYLSRGKSDILIATIGTPKHLGRDRVADRGVRLKQLFGGVPHPGSSISLVDPGQLMRNMEKKFMKNMEEMVQERVGNAVAEVCIITNFGL